MAKARQLSRKAVKTVSDVDIDLKNAREVRLAQRRGVTVRTLSKVWYGVYGDELIASWLNDNPQGGPDEH